MALPLRHLVVRTAAAIALAGVALPLTGGRAEPAPVTATGITPHRAVYRMALHSARNSSKIADVRGAMMYEQSDACDGWTTEQRFQLRFTYAEGEEMNMTTNYTTWEAKSGLRYRFNVRKLVNGETDEEVRGQARLRSKGGSGDVHYLMPEANVVKLPAGAMFPTTHTMKLLEQARRNERFFNRVVFDGADAEGATEISAVIGLAKLADSSVDSPLVSGQTSWPVRMAFFPLASSNDLPEYEISLRLLGNGIVGGMQIDYGDFIVDAVLERIEPLPKPKC